MEALLSQVAEFSSRYLTSPDSRLFAIALISSWSLWVDGRFPDEVVQGREAVIGAILRARSASEAEV